MNIIPNVRPTSPLMLGLLTITVTAQGTTFSAAIDGVSVCSATNTALANGGIALGTDGGQAAFDDVNVTSPKL